MRTGLTAVDGQEGPGAHLTAAIKRRAETIPGISYPEADTHTDEVVQPNSGSNAGGYTPEAG